ncbi:F0F1 ATP synthase subunit epsilon [Blattabacterium cuenoti]|uniref:F0F1 ATP synthase subunit epsilon n=1 Tax=Blattabacterium cuenoti TaxID=1653831 RepID=UPI00163D10A2|nr:F0F1 ATP synthase subunit epsilon [Blattabacterium cuenoti]
MQVTIINYEKVFYQDSATSITAPGLNGFFQILENHDSMISLLGGGFLKLSSFKKKNFIIKINGGLLQVKKNIVFILL